MSRWPALRRAAACGAELLSSPLSSAPSTSAAVEALQRRAGVRLGSRAHLSCGVAQGRYCTGYRASRGENCRVIGINNHIQCPRRYSSSSSSNTTTTDSSLLKQLRDQIRMTGPITVHQYMRAVLTHPKGGYYMDHDPLGEAGDFITSPEISQMFGELLGVWVYSEWHKMGKETPLQLIELGPGRGTLVKDVLRSLQQLGLTGDDVHVHLVEISSHYRHLQRRTVCSSDAGEHDDPCELSSPLRTPSQTPVHWHQHLDTVPAGFSIFLAHEFFDALPIHKLVKNDAGKWREVLIDISGDVGYGGYGKAGGESGDDASNASRDATDRVSNAETPQSAGSSSNAEELPLRYVLSREATPAAAMYTEDLEDRDMVEVCPDAALIAGQIGARITERGGALLVVDYGHNGSKGETFRAFRQHRQQHPLLSPGAADLTADVDFSLLKKALPETVVSFGPVSQGFFLKNMGIELRLLKLLQSSKSSSAHSALVSSYRRLVEDMGGAFSVWAVYPRVMEAMLRKYPPPGFVRQLDEGWSSATMQRVEDITRKMTDSDNVNKTE